MTITFEYHPIKTAPKDRPIMLYSNGVWVEAEWDDGFGEFIGCSEGFDWCYQMSAFKFWAEIAEMAVPE